VIGTIALLTDFGLDDPYVGQLKGVLRALAPGCACLDISHGVRPHGILQASFFLAASRPFFPPGTVFLTVVDPGVGTQREVALVQAHDQLFLAPDNGLVTLVLSGAAPARAWLLDPAFASGTTASATFHGRDIFAPLAARLASGEDPQRFGRTVPPERLTRLAAAVPVQEGPRLSCTVLHVDRFGNAILSLTRQSWEKTLFATPSLTLRSPAIAPVVPSPTYARIPAGSIGLVPGSQGHLELAMDRRAAAAELGLDIGTETVLDLGEMNQG
jgi:S-adenosyl-L-methionine hydrolase (adenosine-forming)